MAFKLVCTHPFHGYEKGQEVTDHDEVARLSEDREHHFVRVAAPLELAVVQAADGSRFAIEVTSPAPAHPEDAEHHGA